MHHDNSRDHPTYLCPFRSRSRVPDDPFCTGQSPSNYRGREQACACPPAQIPTCALTHGAPASDDDERPLVRPRALRPVAITRETPTQGRHRKCVLHYLNRQCRVVVSTDRLGVDPQRPLTAWVPRPAGPRALGM